MASPADKDLFAPPSADELQKAKAMVATKSHVPPPDLFAPPSEEERAAARLAAPKIGGTESAVRAVATAVAPVVVPIAKTVDRFTGAPVRSAIGAVQQGQNPAMAFMNQFGADPEQAPTGKEIAKRAGLGETTLSEVAPSMFSEDGTGWKLRKGGLLDPTASGAAGLAIDAVSDPLNVVGVGEVAQVAKQGAKIAAKGAGKIVKGTSIFADVATGTNAASKTVKGVEAAVDTTSKVANRVAETAKKSIDDLVNPKMAPDAGEMRSIAKRQGIPEDLIAPAHDFGERSSITRLQKNLAEDAGGEKFLEAQAKGIAKTSEALEKGITVKFGQAPTTARDAGELLKDAVETHVSRVLDDADITYKSAAKQFPGLQINAAAMNALRSKAIGMKREAAKILRTSKHPEHLGQARNLMEWSDLLLNSKGSYKEMSEIVQNVGKAAYEKAKPGVIAADRKKLRELYDVGSEALIHSIRKVDQNAADRLIINNAEISEMITDRGTLGKIIQDGSKNPEQIFNTLVKNGGSKQIETLKKILPEETFNRMRGKVLQDLIKYQADDVSVAFGPTLRNLEKNSERLSYLFQADELKDMTELLKFGDRYGTPAKNPYGTGASQGFRGFAKNLIMGAQDEQALEYMKAKARGQTPKSSPAAPTSQVLNPTNGSSSSPAPAGQAAAPAGRRKLLRDRGPVERRLKAGQTVAPSTYERPAKPSSGEGEQQQDEKDRKPASGSQKWIHDGAEKLEKHGAVIDRRILKDPKAKKLLLAASDLKPGSKAMNAIAERIRRLYG